MEPTDDGVNWQLLIEGVPIATVNDAGKSKPDGKTITIDPDGTLHGASQVPEGVTYVDLQSSDSEQLLIGFQWMRILWMEIRLSIL